MRLANSSNSQTDIIVHQLVSQSTHATGKQLAGIVAAAGAAPFAADLLEVDEPLWGSFWHGDVIAPGYRLPALELAVLRATRLDKNWPVQTDTIQFLADLRRAIHHPRAGVWTLAAAGAPCVVFATPTNGLVTVVWYCAATGQLHAGYRTAANALYFESAVIQKKLVRQASDTFDSVEWLAEIVDSRQDGEPQNLAVRLDGEILRLRWAGLRR